MDVQIEDIDSCNKQIKVVIPQKKYKERVNAYLKQVGRDVKIPGFRKGKIPPSMLEQRVGPEAKREVLTQLISETLLHALDERGIRAAGLPSLLEVHGEEGTDIDVSASVEVFPEFEVKDYSSMEIPLKIKPAADAEVDKVVDFYRSRTAKITPISDRPVKDQDVATIDFKGTIDGKPFEGGEGQDKVLLVGGKMFLEDLEKQLVGMEIGESKAMNVQVPEHYPKHDIAGKTVQFDVILKNIQERELPELDDTFAKNADPEKNFENLEDMRNKIREELAVESRNNGRKEAKQVLARKMTEDNPIDVPEILVKNQIRHMARQAKQQAGGGSEPSGDSNEPPTPEEDQAYRETAVKLIQEELIILKLAEDLGIQIEEKEVEREVTSFIKLLGEKNPVKVRKEWDRNGTLDRIRSRMIRDKTLESLLDKVQLKEEMVDS